MSFTPDEVDRQPFRMRKRGYDIGEVREFLRKLAQQMRDDSVRTSTPPALDRRVATAATEAQRIIEHAEMTARRRSDQVLRETQARLDALLDQEREVRERLSSHAEDASQVTDAALIDLPPAIRAPTGPTTAAPDRSLADFMKSAVRDEIS